MSHLSFFTVLLTISSFCAAQVKWDGGGGNNLWNDALNWAGNELPAPDDDVLLDHSVIGTSYLVSLPGMAVTVRSITIESGIELLLPASNTTVPALTLQNLMIRAGGIFRNSSGAASGTPLQVLDSIAIFNGGQLIHNTARGHAGNMERLSAAAGTETGIVQFDIPDASTTISLSGRTFGTLMFSSASFGSTINYTAAGTSRVNIRGDLVIEADVNLNLNFSDTIWVVGNLIQNRSIFNIGNNTRHMVLAVMGNISQRFSSLLTETGGGVQEILLNGANPQELAIDSIANSIAIVRNGTGSIRLTRDLRVPFHLVLKKGKIITDGDRRLILEKNCSLEVDSLSDDCYVIGPVKKEGMDNSDFLFPVGGSNGMRLLALNAATGDFIVEYFPGDPRAIQKNMGNGMHHISTLEYWSVLAGADATAIVKLSFNDPNSGGVTDLNSLRVGRLGAGVWEDAGNTDHEGTPGSNGWVSSNAASGFSAGSNLFALASAISQENPLPLVVRPRMIPERVTKNEIALMNTLNVTSFLIVRVSVIENTPLKFTLFDMQGRAIRNFKITAQKGTTQLKIDVSGLLSGSYILSLVENYKNMRTWKFIKR